MKLSGMKIDAARGEEGAWIADIPDMGDLRLKVRGLRNSAFRRMRDRLAQAVPRDKRAGGQIDPVLMEDITSRCMASTVIVDWENLTGDDDQPIPFSKEVALEMLTDPNLRPFRDAVAYAAAIVEERDTVAAEDVAGNS